MCTKEKLRHEHKSHLKGKIELQQGPYYKNLQLKTAELSEYRTISHLSLTFKGYQAKMSIMSIFL